MGLNAVNHQKEKKKSGTRTLFKNTSRAQIPENARCPRLEAWDPQGGRKALLWEEPSAGEVGCCPEPLRSTVLSSTCLKSSEVATPISSGGFPDHCFRTLMSLSDHGRPLPPMDVVSSFSPGAREEHFL